MSGYSIAGKETQGITANYARSYGRHDFETSSSQTVSVISAPNWDEYWDNLQNAGSLGGIALSPELITAQFDFGDLDSNKYLIEQRVDCVKDLSKDTPGTVYGLGTPVFDPGQKPTNSILYICAGLVVARKNKAYMHPYTPEARTFRTNNDFGPSSLNEHMASLVCADLVNISYLQPRKRPRTFDSRRNSDPSVDENTRLVLMSACWSIPLSMGGKAVPSAQPDEQRYKSQLEGCVTELLKTYPKITDLIIADRLVEGSQVNGPLNCHYQRAT